MAEITSGVVSSGLTVSSGDTLTVDSGGTSLATVDRGAVIVAGLTSGDHVYSGASETVMDGGIVSGGSMSGTLTISAGGEAVGTITGHAGAVLVRGTLTSALTFDSVAILSGGVAIADRVQAAHITIAQGASGSGIITGGDDRASLGVNRFGKVSDDTVASVGTEDVSGTAYRTIVKFGGVQQVLSHGLAQGSTISGGGKLLVDGGIARAVILQGGSVSGGTVIGATVYRGTLDAAVSGNIYLKGAAVLAGSIASGAEVSFRPGGTLEIQNGAVMNGTVYSFTGAARTVDLDGFTYDSGAETAAWAQSGTSGTLTITDGAQVQALTIHGTYIASNFHMADDSQGGTLVYEAPAPKTALFAQAVAGHYSGRSIDAPIIHGGGAVMEAPVAFATSGRA